ncbi:Lipopolysaccharide export system ATP-binding protein LptB [bioreactor metagenome]|jgi:branched-chain amino acid transport system ATP-binding protein|uniref:Amino acid/amide ABC transporter ATP-binding protein 1, HAAT family (TC 3.A.1.4.-) n=2 Tax=root TaxID=1 RepID=A0A562JF24_9FIRM|nr:ABC transporter ATP-binding protein [Sedimentibacter saalensis]MEA5096630.1 ABC transporter ATP-binding protein [Sedimentibacter saalensis]TWH81817.1 amino acid/amide ABC transporter ATP-binding protein 1, HAAT family (TC 3.A.1.4.-) [Sedimentibacter saalensis]
MSVLSLKKLTKKFGGLTAVDNVNFSIEEGEIFGLIGPNGAGKTTIFNLITAIYSVTEGEIYFYDKKLAGLKPFEIANMGITRTFQNIRLFKKLTVYDNVLTACHKLADYSLWNSVVRIGKYKKQERLLNSKTEQLLKLMGLWEYKDIVASNLPYGLQRKLEIARALALEPRLLLLDEPAAGMNPEETLQLMELIKEIRNKFNLTVLIIEHHMDLIMGVCDRIFVLNFGIPLAIGTPKEIQEDKKVIEAYLGKEEVQDA